MSNSILLVALLVLFVIEPFVPPEHSLGHVVFLIVITIVLIAAVWAVGRHLVTRIVGLLIAIPTFIAGWVLHFTYSPQLSGLFLGLGVVFLTFTALVVLRHVLGGDAVTGETIAGAICFYLLLGVIMALVFSLLELAHPGSFLDNGRRLGLSAARARSLVPELLYLSMVTLSTLGYGDVLPVTPPARMLAAMEAIIGQLYLAVLIARLVGLQTQTRPSPRV
jgi:hypothetical protein